MAKMKEQTKASKTFWRIAISAVGIALILLALSNLSLFFFGGRTTAEVTTRRIGGSDDNRPYNQRYQWSVDYTFLDKNEITHSGHTSRRGNDMTVQVENKVYYFPFAPFINSLESETEPNVGQPLLIVIGAFLLFVMNNKKKTSTKFIAVKTPSGEIDVPEIRDYDDSVEEAFHEKW